MPPQPGFAPQPHQQRVIDRAVSADATGDPLRILNYWTVGTGKGYGSLSTVDALRGTAAVVAPAAMRPTFKAEQKKFLGRTDIPVYSYQNAVAGKVPTTDSLIVDEAQRLGGSGSAQSEAVKRLADGAKNVVLLSGTPIRNSPAEFAPLMSVLTGKNITQDQFADRYIGTESERRGLLGYLRGLPRAEKPALVNTDELRHLLDGKIDYYSPESPTVGVEHETHEVEMTPRQAELYNGMFGKLPYLMRVKMRWNYPLSDDELIKARSFLTGPRQVALSDLPYRTDNDPYRAFANSGKLVKAKQLLDETLSSDDRKKAIVYSNFLKAGLQPYSAALTRSGVPHAVFHGGLSDQERRALVDDFNSGKLRVALVAPAGAEGISLKGAQLLQILDPYWNKARTEQAAGRGIRYDSHSHLPEELKNIKVQKFVAKLPLTTRNRIMEGLGFDRSSSRTAVDDYLVNMADRKDVLNRQMLDLLKEIGSNNAKKALDEVYSVLSLEETIKLAEVVGSIRGPADEYCPSCDARLERDPYSGTCNSCGSEWPEKASAHVPLGGSVSYDYYCKSCDHHFDGEGGVCPCCDKDRSWTTTNPKLTKESADNPFREAKRYSDIGTPEGYAKKTEILRGLIADNPADWYVDSRQPHVVGLTHVRSGWRYHLPMYAAYDLVRTIDAARRRTGPGRASPDLSASL
jgi:hypothetical protein